MSDSHTFEEVKLAIGGSRVLVSGHASQEAAEDALTLDEIEAVTLRGEAIEDYPQDPRGRSCLVLGRTPSGAPVHALWGHDAQSGHAILITVYRPDPARWDEGFRARRRRSEIEP